MQKLIRPLFSIYKNAATVTDDSRKTVTHYISGGEANDYGQVLDPAGYDDSRYRKNPIVLFQHGLNDMFSSTPAKLQLDFVIGRNTYIKTDNNMLIAETEFRTDDNSNFADDVFNLYRLGFLNGWSKWFYPISEPRYGSEQGDNKVYYDKWGIYEYSAVFIPVDAEAVTAEVNYLNALDSVRSSEMKTYFMHSLLNSKTASDNDTASFINELHAVKAELQKASSRNFEEEINNLTNERIEKYHRLIFPKLEDFAKGLKELSDLRCNLEALVESAVKNSLNNLSGKVK